MQLGTKKFILNNHTSKINFFPVLRTIFFPLEDQKMDLFAPHGGEKLHF